MGQLKARCQKLPQKATALQCLVCCHEPGRYRDLFVCGRFLALATLHGGQLVKELQVSTDSYSERCRSAFADATISVSWLAYMCGCRSIRSIPLQAVQ